MLQFSHSWLLPLAKGAQGCCFNNHHPLPICLLKRMEFTFQARSAGDLGIPVSLSGRGASVESLRTAVSDPRYPPTFQKKSRSALSLTKSREEEGTEQWRNLPVPRGVTGDPCHPLLKAAGEKAQENHVLLGNHTSHSGYPRRRI